MPDISDIRLGVIMVMNGEPFQVIWSNRMRTAQRKPVMQTKLRNIITGRVLEYSFKYGEKFEEADVARERANFLYADEDGTHFMNQETFEQFEGPADLVGDGAGYIKEGDMVQLQFFDGRPINVELPKNVPLKVTYTENAVKGDTSSSITKDATLETGITIKVPAFIKQGDMISVDTSTGAYRERVKG